MKHCEVLCPSTKFTFNMFVLLKTTSQGSSSLFTCISFSLRTVCFEDYGDTGEEGDSSTEATATKMCHRLCQKFGLESESPMAEAVLHLTCKFEAWKL